ncbi:low affinity iron permease family protein [Achromobacter anxifer]
MSRPRLSRPRLSRPRLSRPRAAHTGHASAGHANPVSRFFDHFAAHVTRWVGSPIAFGLALIAVIVWAVSGPAFGYSEIWQLVINTGTTIVTFLMVFLIQQSQNKDSEALHLKLDELLIALKGADEGLVDVERLDEDKLLALAAACTARARQERRRKRTRREP